MRLALATARQSVYDAAPAIAAAQPTSTAAATTAAAAGARVTGIKRSLDGDVPPTTTAAVTSATGVDSAATTLASAAAAAIASAAQTVASALDAFVPYVNVECNALFYCGRFALESCRSLSLNASLAEVLLHQMQLTHTTLVDHLGSIMFFLCSFARLVDFVAAQSSLPTRCRRD